jgi:hypothetical protein
VDAVVAVAKSEPAAAALDFGSSFADLAANELAQSGAGKG